MTKKGSILKVFKKRQQDKVLDKLRKQVEDNPSDIKARNHLGDYLLRAGQKDAAAEEYRQVADFYAEDGLNNKAIAIYKKILSFNQDEIEIYVKLSELYEKEKLLNEAFGQLSKVKYHYQQNQMHEETVDVLKKMKEINPQETEIRTELIKTCFRVNMKDMAIEEYQDLASLAKDDRKIEELIQISDDILAEFPQNPIINNHHYELAIRIVFHNHQF